MGVSGGAEETTRVGGFPAGGFYFVVSNFGGVVGGTAAGYVEPSHFDGFVAGEGAWDPFVGLFELGN